MAYTGSLEDRMAIRELHETYADAGFRCDKEQWLNCFADDCVWNTPTGHVSGREQLKAQWDMIWSTMAAVGFFTVMGSCEIDGDRATTRAYIREVFLARDESMMKLVGRYDDQLVRVDGAWKFAKRDYSVIIREV